MTAIKRVARKPKRPPKKDGRKPLLTDAMIEFICTRISIGCTIENSARAAGISDATIYRWRREGEDHEKEGRNSQQRKFYEEFTRAFGKSEVALVSDLKKLSQGYDLDVVEEKFDGSGNLIERTIKKRHIQRDAKAAIFLLTARFPELWANRKSVELSGGVDVKGARERLTPLLGNPTALDLADQMADLIVADKGDAGADD